MADIYAQKQGERATEELKKKAGKRLRAHKSSGHYKVMEK